MTSRPRTVARATQALVAPRRMASYRCLAVVLAFLVGPAGAQSLSDLLQPIAQFGANPGQLDMYVFVPPQLAPKPALVVALHGCQQRAVDFDDETGLTRLAEAFGLVLVFPEQRRANNATGCFNWFEPNDNQRERGESG